MPTQVIFTMLTPEDIGDALAPALAKLDMERAVIWGSYANGRPHPGSDLNLILIKETDLDRHKRHQECSYPLWEALYEEHQKYRNWGVQTYPPQLDLSIFTPAEWEGQARRNTLRYQKVSTEGVVIYDRARQPAPV